MGVSQQLVTRALAKVIGDRGGGRRPSLDGRLGADAREFFETLRRHADGERRRPQPARIPSASPMRWKGRPLRRSATVTLWQAEWKWDGIRSQLIRRGRDRRSSGLAARSSSPSVIPSWPPWAPASRAGRRSTARSSPGRMTPPCPSRSCRRRIGRKTVGKTILADVPVVLVAYDLLEHEGSDVRGWELSRAPGATRKTVSRASTGPAACASRRSSSRDFVGRPGRRPARLAARFRRRA